MSGRIASDGYPKKYHDNFVSTAIIQVPSQYRIHLQVCAWAECFQNEMTRYAVWYMIRNAEA